MCTHTVSHLQFARCFSECTRIGLCPKRLTIIIKKIDAEKMWGASVSMEAIRGGFSYRCLGFTVRCENERVMPKASKEKWALRWVGCEETPAHRCPGRQVSWEAVPSTVFLAV